VPDNQHPGNSYFDEITRHVRRYSTYGQQQDLEAARTMILAMAIDQGYSPADVQAMTLLIMPGQPA
jgi:hypothetical protein